MIIWFLCSLVPCYFYWKRVLRVYPNLLDSPMSCKMKASFIGCVLLLGGPISLIMFLAEWNSMRDADGVYVAKSQLFF